MSFVTDNAAFSLFKTADQCYQDNYAVSRKNNKKDKTQSVGKL